MDKIETTQKVQKGNVHNPSLICTICSREAPPDFLTRKRLIIERNMKDIIKLNPDDLVQFNHRRPKKVIGGDAAVQGSCDLTYCLNCFQKFVITQAQKNMD